jgi:hypothetical protein
MSEYKVRYDMDRSKWHVTLYCLIERERVVTRTFNTLKEARDYVLLISRT